MADFLDTNDCTNGIGTTTNQDCPFRLGDIRIATFIDRNAANPFTGLDQAEQEDNMQDQAVWTAAQALSAPDNLYVSPRFISNDLPETNHTYAKLGFNDTETKTENGTQEITFTISRINPEVSTQLRKLEGRTVKFQLINKEGGLWYKKIENGTDYPFFDSAGPCKVSSVIGADNTPISMTLKVPVAIDWFDGMMTTVALPNALDVTGITEVQQRLIEN